MRYTEAVLKLRNFTVELIEYHSFLKATILVTEQVKFLHEHKLTNKVSTDGITALMEHWLKMGLFREIEYTTKATKEYRVKSLYVAKGIEFTSMGVPEDMISKEDVSE